VKNRNAFFAVNPRLPITATLLAGILGLAASFAQADSTDDFQRGAAAHRQGDYQKAVRLWQPLAEKGIVNAQFNLATMYYVGEGVKQDYAEALKWFRKAAEQGDIEAQYYLGHMYLRGEGVAQDEAEARKWFGMNRARRHGGHSHMQQADAPQRLVKADRR
jgi:TPR repeat protein